MTAYEIPFRMWECRKLLRGLGLTVELICGDSEQAVQKVPGGWIIFTQTMLAEYRGNLGRVQDKLMNVFIPDAHHKLETDFLN